VTSTQLDRGTIRRHLDSFAADWRTIIDDWRATDAKHTEKSHAQQFWSDLLRCFGVIPERIRLFERDATRASSGRTGYIDLFWSGVDIGEAKSPGRDLDAATAQARDYLAGGSIGQHEWPRYAIVSDFENIRVTKLGDDGWTVAFTIDEITAHVDQLIFLAGQETVTKAEEEEASIHASKLMANLYTAMLGDDDADEAVGDDAPTDPEEEDWQVQKTSVFLTRVLFLLYGDDAGLWEEDLFYRFVLYDTTGETLGSRLNALFQVLNTPENRRRRVPEEMAKFPYVNGSLFSDQWPQDFFDDEMRDALLDACRFHWTRISPAVFGSMFQLVKSKEARRADGEHYTTETNILKVIEPLFLDELRDKANRLVHNKSTTVKALREFRDSLAQMIFLDPACGCGNFLVVAYRELRAIETDIIVALRAKEGQQTASMDVSLDQRMNIGQFHGFELNWWPAKIAETAMFLVDHQANRALCVLSIFRRHEGHRKTGTVDTKTGTADTPPCPQNLHSRHQRVRHTVRTAGEEHQSTVMHNPVNDRSGHRVITEHRPPPRELQIRGDHQRVLLIRCGDDLEQQPCTVGVDRQVPELIDDQQAVLPDAGELLVQPSCLFRPT